VDICPRHFGGAATSCRRQPSELAQNRPADALRGHPDLDVVRIERKSALGGTVECDEGEAGRLPVPRLAGQYLPGKSERLRGRVVVTVRRRVLRLLARRGRLASQQDEEELRRSERTRVDPRPVRPPGVRAGRARGGREEGR